MVFPTGERKKYAAKILQKIETASVREIASKFSVSTASVNLFLCHLAYSAALNHHDIAINVAEQNRSRKYRRTVGTFAISLFHRVKFTEDTGLHRAFVDSFSKLNENFDHSRVIAPKNAVHFLLRKFIGKGSEGMK